MRKKRIRRRQAKKRAVGRHTRDINALLKRFPVQQDPSLLPANQTELWEATTERPVIIRRRAS
jgi:hypothetical protein